MLLVHSGDIIGTEMPHDWITRGQVTLQALESIAEAAGIDHCYSVVGNHDLDFGVDGLAELRAKARRFEFLAGNLSLDGTQVSPVLRVVTIDGIRLGLLNLTVEATRDDAPTDALPRIALGDPMEVGRDALAEAVARKEAGELDLTVGVVHLSDKQDEELVAPEGIDLLLGGHSHAFFKGALGGRDASYSKCGCYATALGTVTLEVTDDGVQMLDGEWWLLPAISVSRPRSRVAVGLQSTLAEIRTQEPDRFREIAFLEESVRGLNRVRSADVPIGRLVADMMLMTARRAYGEHVHFAFINGGNIRSDLDGDPRPVRTVDIHAIVPYNNEIITVEAGLELVQLALHNFVACAKVEPQGFLQVAGLRFGVRGDGSIEAVEVEARTAAWGTEWRPLDEMDRLRFASIDYLIDGGHHYGFLANAGQTRTGERLLDAWLRSLAEASTEGLPRIRPPRDRRIRIADSFLGAPARDILSQIYEASDRQLDWAK